MAKGVLVLRRHLVVGGIVAALAFGGLIAAGVAAATVTPNTYSACLSSVGGIPYNVTVNGTPKCLGKDKVINWNQTGPAGTSGSNGTNGTNGTNGASFLTSSGVPNVLSQNLLCVPGDSDVDLATGEVYKCTPLSGVTLPTLPSGQHVTATWVDTGQSIQGPAGPAGPSNLAALQGSPCTIDGFASTINVTVDPSSGAVSIICNPAVVPTT